MTARGIFLQNTEERHTKTSCSALLCTVLLHMAPGSSEVSPLTYFLPHCTWKSCSTPEAGNPNQLLPGLTVQVWPTLHAQSQSETCTVWREMARVWAMSWAPVLTMKHPLITPTSLNMRTCLHKMPGAAYPKPETVCQKHPGSFQCGLQEKQETWSKEISQMGFLLPRIILMLPPAQMW